jgi:hypothetical protein
MQIKLNLYSADQMRAFARFAEEMARIEDSRPKEKIGYVGASVALEDFDRLPPALGGGEQLPPAATETPECGAELLDGAAPLVERERQGMEAVAATTTAEPQRKKRRTKAEIEADKAAKEAIKAQKDTPDGMRALRTPADTEAAKAAGDIIIYNNAGEERAGFTHSEHAADVLIKVIISGAPDEKSLTDLLLTVNAPALKRLTDADRGRVLDAYGERCKSFTAAAAGDEDPTDFMSVGAVGTTETTAQPSTPAAAPTASNEPSTLQMLISEFGRKKGYQKFTALFKKYGATRLSDIEAMPDKHAEIRAYIEAELAA